MPANRDLVLLGLLAVAAVGVSACSHGHRESDSLCGGRILSPVAEELVRGAAFRTVQWTPDGSRILFSFAENVELAGTYGIDLGDTPDIYAVHVSGEPVHKIVDLPPAEPAYNAGDDFMTFDLSPDGSRIAYTRCAVSEETIHSQEGEWQVENAEIFVTSFDGTNVDRLTNNTYLDALPAWSPDGESIAYISDPDRSILWEREGRKRVWRSTTRITIHEVATGRSREIGLPAGLAAAPIRLEWSPSGDRIAFVVLKGERHPWDLAVYIVGVDGTGLTRVSDALSGPAWSPDGQSIALVVPEVDGAWALYTFAADGLNPVKVHFDIRDRYSTVKGTNLGPERWAGKLSWSPDESEAAVLLERYWGDRLSQVAQGPAVIPLGSGGVGTGMPGGTQARSSTVTAGAGRGSILASPQSTHYYPWVMSAWSPDGTQIAMLNDRATYIEVLVSDLQGPPKKLLGWKRVLGSDEGY